MPNITCTYIKLSLFDPDCSELCDPMTDFVVSAIQLYKDVTNICHGSVVQLWLTVHDVRLFNVFVHVQNVNTEAITTEISFVKVQQTTV